MRTTQSGRMEPQTVSAKVYQLIKNDIINGTFPPGSHLVRRVLAKKYGVSPLPIMEACFRLENDGLVENSPMLGTHVVDINGEVVAEEYKLREALECQAARLFAITASAINKQQVRMLAQFVDSIEDKLETGDEEMEAAFQKHHSDFHLFVAKMSGAKLIYRQMKKLWFRRIMVAGDANAKLFPVPKGWHQLLAEKLSGDDPDAAEQQMRMHITYNKDKIDDSVKAVIDSGKMGLIGKLLLQQGEADVDAEE